MRKDHIPKFGEYKVRPRFKRCTRFILLMHTLQYGGRIKRCTSVRCVMQSMLGLRPSNHTDFVVAPLDQMMMLSSAVNRTSRGGADIGLGQRVTPYEGLFAMTAWVAEQYGEQDSKGTLEVGKLADLVILDQDPLKVDPRKIKDIKVVETI